MLDFHIDYFAHGLGAVLAIITLVAPIVVRPRRAN